MKIVSYLLLFLSLSMLFSCTKPHDHAATDNDQESYWTCSMHPQIKKDGPGKCPICGMDLIQVTQESKTTQESSSTTDFPSGHGQIHLTPKQQDMIGVKTGVVVKKKVFKQIEVAGRVAFDPELFSAINEYIESMKQAESVQNSIVSEVKKSAKAMINSSKMRLKILGLSDKQIAEINYSNQDITNYLIPQVNDQLWIYADVYEIDLPYVHPKLIAKISAHSLADQSIEGEVISVDRVINPTTRTAKVRISLKAATKSLRPESYVDVSILSPMGEQLVVPFDSVFDTGKEMWLFVIDEVGKIAPRLLSKYRFAGDDIIVDSGVSEGERIITSANFLIDSESRLKWARESSISNAPACPKGQKWSEAMNHCM